MITFGYLQICSYGTAADILKMASMSTGMTALINDNKHLGIIGEDWGRRALRLKIDQWCQLNI